MNTEKIYTVRMAMTAGICLAYITCAQQSEVLRRIGFGWRIVLAGLAGALISLAVNIAAYYAEKSLSRNGPALLPFWQYVKAKNIKRKPRHVVAGAAAAVLAMLMGEFVHFPVMNPAMQIFGGALIGLAVGLLVEYSLGPDAPVANTVK